MNAKEIKQKYDLRGSPTSGLAMATFGFFVGFAAVSLYGPAATEFKEAMGLSGLMLGLLVAAPQLTGSLLRIPFGAWVDKVGGKKSLLTLLVMSLVGMAGLTSILHFAYPENMGIELYPLIIIFGLLSGCGVATFSVGIPQTSYWYPQKKQGFALGTYAGLGNTAPGFFGILLPIVVGFFGGLTVPYGIWFAFLLAGTIVYAIFAQDAYCFQLVKRVPRDEAQKICNTLGQDLFPSGKLIDSLKIAARIPRTWALVVLYFTSFGGFLALTTWFPTYWALYHGFGLREAGLLMAVGFSLLASFIRIFGGLVSDRIGGEKTAIISYILVLIGASILLMADSFAVALAGEIFIGSGMGIANAAVFKLVPRYVPKAPGGASGWVGGLGAFGGFVVPPILGVFVDTLGTEGYARGFIVYIVLAISSIIISLILARKYSHQT